MNTLALVGQLAAGEETAAVTMDVFDTALTRCWAKPEHAFLACAERLRALGLTEMSDESWMHARQLAEVSAVARFGPDMAQLADIYDELSVSLRWTEADTIAAITIETDVEGDSVRQVPRTLDFCRRIGREGLPLRFLSDMYLPEHVVARLLEHAGHRVKPEQVWVSASRRASKRQGRLFELALDAWKDLPAKQVLHVGDNAHSDVHQARRAGMRALRIDDARLPPSARTLLAATGAPLKLRSLVAGAMRNALLHAPAATDAHQAGLWRMGSCHGGPLLTKYVWWLLLQAQRDKLKRLYFLARDGQVLLDIAQILQSAGVGVDIELRYLHASRQAWFAPSLTQWSAPLLFRVLDEPDRLSDPAKLARRLGFKGTDEMLQCWPQLSQGLAPEMSNGEVAELLVRVVPADSALAHTASLRRCTLEYLQTNGLFDGASWGIVDLGWRGRLQECLARIVRCHPAAAGLRAHGYYLGLLEPPRDMPPGWQALGFASPGQPDSRLPGPAHLLELLCEADHGSTRGYARDATGQVRAVFNAKPDAAMMEWGLATYRAAVRSYAHQLADSLPMLCQTNITEEALLVLAQTIGREFFGRAEPLAAAAFARMPCSHSITHDDAEELAAPLGLLDAWCRALTLGRLRLGQRSSHWLPGSLARSDPRAYSTHVFIHRLIDKWRGRMIRKNKAR